MFTGHQLKVYREKIGWTQEELGHHVCMSRTAIAKIEASNRPISNFETLKALQKALHIPYGIIGFIPIEVLEVNS